MRVKNRDNKLSWPEQHDYLKGTRRFKSDLVSASILVARYFVAEREAIEALDNQLATLGQQLVEMREENSGRGWATCRGQRSAKKATKQKIAEKSRKGCG